MKTFNNKKIKRGEKYYAIERKKYPPRFMQILVIELIEKENRILVDFPYIETELIKLLPQELFATKKEILKYLNSEVKHTRKRDKDGYLIK